MEAYPNKLFWGKVSQIRQAPITVQNVVTYDVVVNVANPKLELLPGMTANTRIIADERKDVLRVPNQAIRFNPAGVLQDKKGSKTNGTGHQTRVWVLRDGRPQSVPVTLGLRDNTHVEISGGDIHVGDPVIVNAITSTSDSSSQRRNHLRF